MIVTKDSIDYSTNKTRDKEASIAFRFPDHTHSIQVRYGISFISEEQAKANLQREIPDYDFNNQLTSAQNIWNET